MLEIHYIDAQEINFNMRCIEIKLLLRVDRIRPDKLQHEMY